MLAGCASAFFMQPSARHHIKDRQMADFPAQINVPAIQRVRHELRQRDLEVKAITRLTPHMIRITLIGAELAGFSSPSSDDHIKIFIHDEHGSVVRRDYTPRRYDLEASELLLDFVDHLGGPAAAWARTARPGDRLKIGGPKGSQIITGQIDHWLLIGDETALPSIGRRVEELSSQDSVTTVIAVSGQEDEQSFYTKARHLAHWVYRPMDQGDRPYGLLARLNEVEIPENTFIWVGAEASVAKTLRKYFVQERNVPEQWIKASGYWIKGQADGSVKEVGAIS